MPTARVRFLAAEAPWAGAQLSRPRAALQGLGQTGAPAPGAPKVVARGQSCLQARCPRRPRAPHESRAHLPVPAHRPSPSLPSAGSGSLTGETGSVLAGDAGRVRTVLRGSQRLSDSRWPAGSEHRRALAFPKGKGQCISPRRPLHDHKPGVWRQGQPSNMINTASEGFKQPSPPLRVRGTRRRRRRGEDTAVGLVGSHESRRRVSPAPGPSPPIPGQQACHCLPLIFPASL